MGITYDNEIIGKEKKMSLLVMISVTFLFVCFLHVNMLIQIYKGTRRLVVNTRRINSGQEKDCYKQKISFKKNRNMKLVH